MHTDARTTSTISVAKDAADGDGINKLVHQYRSDCETLQPHSIWTVITASPRHLPICRLHWKFVESEISTRSISRLEKKELQALKLASCLANTFFRKRYNGINTLLIVRHYAPATSKNGMLICASQDFHKSARTEQQTITGVIR